MGIKIFGKNVFNKAIHMYMGYVPAITVLASRASEYHLDTGNSQKSPFRTPKFQKE